MRLLDAASAYARRGLRVFMCEPGGKRPLTDAALGLVHGVKDATSDPALIATWWAAHHHANVGIATGAASAVWVLDVDGEAGAATLAGLEAEHGALPPTPTQITGGGEHRLFAWPGDGLGAPNTAGRLGPGLDTRGEGGYIVAAPSVHPSGALYRWTTGAKLALAQAPQWLLDGVRKPERAAAAAVAPPDMAAIPDAYGRAALEGEYAIVAGAGEGRRNAALNTGAFNLGQLVAAGALTASETTAALLAAAQANGQLGEEGRPAIIAVIESGMLAGMATGRAIKPLPERPTLRIRLSALAPTSKPALALAPAPAPKPHLRIVGAEDGGDGDGGPSAGGYTLNAKGNLSPNSMRNAVGLLAEPDLAGLFATDEFTGQVAVSRASPWGPARTLTDADVVGLAAHLERTYSFAMTLGNLHAAVRFAAGLTLVHPVRDALRAIKWDGNFRLNVWLETYLSAEPSKFNRTVGPKWLIGAVARVMRPGCKVDTMLILEGAQGQKKSTALAALATLGGVSYFTDHLPKIGSKDCALELQGRLIVELSELDAMHRAEISAVKMWLSQCVDRYRPPYGREVIERPRQCVFAGTVNPGAAGYLNDPTGGRRFWPVAVGAIDLRGLAAIAPQLWAEALYRYEADEKWWIESDEVLGEAREQQRDRFEIDAWAAKIDPYLVGRDRVRVAEILSEALHIEADKWEVAKQRRIGAYLRFVGWERRKGRDAGPDGKLTWYFFRPEEGGDAGH